MTAAQALTPGLSSPSSSRSSGAGTGAGTGRGITSFGDTLDRASKGGPDPASGSRGREASRSKPQGAAAGAETTVSGQEAGPAASVVPPQPARGASSVQSGEARDAANALAQRLQAALGQADAALQGGAAQDRGPWLPGMVDEGEMFDAARLLAIMRSDGAQAATGATVVTVLGQERHLALGRMSPELAGALAQEQDLAAALRGEAKAAASAAALSSQADAAGDGLERGRGKAEGDEMGRFGSEVGGGRRGALFASEGRGQSGGGLGDQGQEGRQQDGRSSGNGGQPTSGAFASAMQGVGPQAANVGRGAPGVSGTQHDPLSDQIAGRIRTELAAGGLGEPSSEGVVKVLSLELKPANLGAVTVRMSLKDNVISLHVEAQHAETRALIEREQAKLTSALSAAGYAVEAITAVQSDGVRPGGMATPGDSSSSGGFQEPGNQNQGASDSSGDERSRRPSAGGDHDRPAPGGNDDKAAAARRGVDGVYV